MDVFGGSGLTKATNHFGTRGYVLDTKFGPWYVTQPLVLTRIRQDVSAGKCVAAIISPPRQHTSCSSEVLSANASIADFLHRAHMPWILEHPCDPWLWAKTPNSCGTTSHGWALSDSFHFWYTVQKAVQCFGLDTWTADLHRIVRIVCWDCGHSSVWTHDDSREHTF